MSLHASLHTNGPLIGEHVKVTASASHKSGTHWFEIGHDGQTVTVFSEDTEDLLTIALAVLQAYSNVADIPVIVFEAELDQYDDIPIPGERLGSVLPR